MKVEVIQEVIKESYPCLMQSINNDCIVLFSSYKYGTCISSGSSDNEIGETSSTWAMDLFVTFTGTITLSND